MGDRYLRKLLVVGATPLVQRARKRSGSVGPCLVDLLARKPTQVATVAMANETVWIVWAVLTRKTIYQAPHKPMLTA